MNNFLNKDMLPEQPTPEIKRLTTSLLYTFRLDERCKQAVKAHQQSNTLEEAIHRWEWL